MLPELSPNKAERKSALKYALEKLTLPYVASSETKLESVLREHIKWFHLDVLLSRFVGWTQNHLPLCADLPGAIKCQYIDFYATAYFPL